MTSRELTFSIALKPQGEVIISIPVSVTYMVCTLYLSPAQSPFLLCLHRVYQQEHKINLSKVFDLRIKLGLDLSCAF